MKTIHISRVLKDAYVLINKTGIIETKKAMRVTTKKQTIEGCELPAGLGIWIKGGSVELIHNRFSDIPSVYMQKEQINAILKSLYLRSL